MNFIIIYNKSTGYTEEILPEEDNDIAFELFKSKTDEFEDNKDIEVNYVTADDEADLKKYWKRFFNRI
jgi:hypothetical protein